MIFYIGLVTGGGRTLTEQEYSWLAIPLTRCVVTASTGLSIAGRIASSCGRQAIGRPEPWDSDAA